MNNELAFIITISDGFVAWRFIRIGNDEPCQRCAFLDTESKKITEIALSPDCVDMEEMEVRWAEGKTFTVKVLWLKYATKTFGLLT